MNLLSKAQLYICIAISLSFFAQIFTLKLCAQTCPSNINNNGSTLNTTICANEEIILCIDGTDLPLSGDICWYIVPSSGAIPNPGTDELIGCVAIPSGIITGGPVLNEILFNPSDAMDGTAGGTCEFIEIAGTPGFDMSCYILTDGDFMIVLPVGTVIPPDGILVIADATVDCDDFDSSVVDVDLMSCSCCTACDLVLSNTGEFVNLLDPDGFYVDGIIWGSPTPGNQPGMTEIISPTIQCAGTPPTITTNLATPSTPAAVMDGESIARDPDVSGMWVGSKSINGSANTAGLPNSMPDSFCITTSLNENYCGEIYVNSLIGNVDGSCPVGANLGIESNYTMACPNPVITNNGPFCFGIPFELIAVEPTATSWSWTSNGSATIVGSNTATVTITGNVTDGEIFTVVVTDANGCTGTATTTVEISLLPEVEVQLLSGTCEGQEIVLNASGISAVSWIWITNGAGVFDDNSIQSPIVTGASDGDNFTVVVSNANGCSQSDNLIISLSPTPIANLTTVFECEAPVGSGEASFDLTSVESIVTGGALGVTVEWYTNGIFTAPVINPSAFVSGPGFVFAKVTNIATGCFNSSLISLAFQPFCPAITVTKDDADNGDDTQHVFPNGSASFTIVVTNSGNEPLCGLEMLDSATDATLNIEACSLNETETSNLLMGIGNGDDIFDPGETFTYTCDVFEVTTSFTNSITAEANGCFSNEDVADSDDSDVTVPCVIEDLVVTQNCISPSDYELCMTFDRYNTGPNGMFNVFVDLSTATIPTNLVGTYSFADYDAAVVVNECFSIPNIDYAGDASDTELLKITVADADAPIPGTGLPPGTVPPDPSLNLVECYQTMNFEEILVDSPVGGPSMFINCGDPPPEISASCIGSTLTWYNAPTGGILQGTGSTLNTANTTSEEGPFNNNAEGTYTFYAQCDLPNGCSSLRTPVTVNVGACCTPPVLTTTVITRTCFGTSAGEIDLILTGGATGDTYSFLWDNGSNSEDLTGLAEGTYTVLVIVNGDPTCTTTESFIVGAYPIPTLTDAEVCEGGTLTMTGSGVPSLSNPYLSSDETVALISPTGNVMALMSGSVTITYTDINGCEADAILKILPNPILNIDISSSPTCPGTSDGTVVFTDPLSSPPYEVMWSDLGGIAGQTLNRNDLMAGNYTVSISDSKGCENSLNFIINDPAPLMISAGSNQEICGLMMAMLMADPVGPGMIGTWTHDGLGIISDVNAHDAMYTPDGADLSNTITFTWTVPSILGDCPSIDSIEILFKNNGCGGFPWDGGTPMND